MLLIQKICHVVDDLNACLQLQENNFNVTFTKLSLLIIVLINIKALFVAVAEATNSFWSSFIEYVISIF